jgi:mannose/fructose/N-acetylgalactosamine-specific phosphotransferase system component IIC
MTGTECLAVAILAFALIGIAAAVIHSRIWPVETAKPEFHRPLQRRAHRDANERR